jgi:GntR family transcriptional regulator
MVHTSKVIDVSIATDRRSDAADELHLYERVVALIADDIATGRLHAGERLTSERALGERLGVSRVTIRKALATLVERGLLVPAARRGWFVAPPSSSGSYPPLQSFTEWASAQGGEVRTVVLKARTRIAKREESVLLRIPGRARLFELERLRLMDAVPISVERSCVPIAVAPDLPRTDFSEASLFAALRKQAGVEPTRAESSVSLEPADNRTAALLDLPEGTSVLRFRETVYDQNDRPFELHTAANRGDGYQWTSVLGSTPESLDGSR